MQKVTLHWDKKPLTLAAAIIGLLLMVALWVARLNIVMLACMIYCALMALFIVVGLFTKSRLYGLLCTGYLLALFGVVSYAVFQGADGGFAAFTTGLAGFSTVEHPWLTGTGSVLTRILGNLLLILPIMAVLGSLFFLCRAPIRKQVLQAVLARVISLFLLFTTVTYILSMNLRMRPNTVQLWEGHDEYLRSVEKNRRASNAPNVLFILMDDLGYGDISLNGATFNTPNIDRIGEEGVSLENFYSSYSVCSPARFAALTGRYPYRGYADNVLFPTANTISPFAVTRLYNSAEMGANVDGMLGDEITLAETLQSAGYATGAFGKWHLGDYGEYLPTNQGFDYFYGSHHVNDMTPYYFVRETAGEYEIVRGTDDLRDQRPTTQWLHEELDGWIRSVVNQTEQPFFAYYASPWPHDPIFVSEEYAGASGVGDYADCIIEFDDYLGVLFNTLEELDVLDDTLIIFSSDNGPAVEGSTGLLRGGKGLTYEGGQKVPFLMRWGNNDLLQAGTVYESSATLVDLFPTLLELCGVSGDSQQGDTHLPQDRAIDGVSMVPLLQSDAVIHTAENPILYMKRGQLQGIQYSIATEDILRREEYAHYDYAVLRENDTIAFKYMDGMRNDNPAFMDKVRNNWLFMLTDDAGESYNRTPVYPSIAKEMEERMTAIMQGLKNNRRGITK